MRTACPLLLILCALLAAPWALGQSSAEQNIVSSAWDNVWTGPQRTDYDILALSLKLTDAATMTPAAQAENITLPDGVRGEILKTYRDPVSGFQAHRVRVDRSPEPPLYTYTFAATQLMAAGPDGQIRPSIDMNDLLTNASFGLHQLESAAAAEVMRDVRADLQSGNKVLMTGQSLGGMMSHGLGYLVARELRESGALNLADNLQVLSWGIPGMGETIRTYLRRKYGREEELDPALVSLNFEEIAYSIDPLRGIGDHFGRVTTIDELSLRPDEDGNYAALPLLNLEAHLLPAFERAVRFQTIPLPGEMICPGGPSGFRLYRPIQDFITDTTGVLLRMRRRAYLADYGTDADWQLCYSAGLWYTNKRRDCTSREQAGCQVRDRRAPASGQELHAQWCMPQ
jgi:hypothetical protein